MLLIYPAIIHEDDDGLWLEFPDLEGCQTQAIHSRNFWPMLPKHLKDMRCAF